MQKSKNTIGVFFLFFLVIQGLGIISGLFTISAISQWYVTLNKPFFTPPNSIFGPVWSLWYLAMSISVYRIYQLGIEKKKVKDALFIFSLHFLFNILWSVLFFGMRSPFYAFIDIVILLFLLFYTIRVFLKLDALSGIILYGYFVWVCFATALNAAFLLLN